MSLKFEGNKLLKVLGQPIQFIEIYAKESFDASTIVRDMASSPLNITNYTFSASANYFMGVINDDLPDAIDVESLTLLNPQPTSEPVFPISIVDAPTGHISIYIPNNLTRSESQAGDTPVIGSPEVFAIVVLTITTSWMNNFNRVETRKTNYGIVVRYADGS